MSNNMDDNQVMKLHGSWASPFSCRVKWGLDLKGIPYENIEEDLNNKSKFLIQNNPVHKKVPVLVDHDHAICESMIIIEYLDEKWPHKHPLLPKQPSERALARFWVKFAEDKGPSIWMVFRTNEEEQEKAKKECVEMLRTMEEQAAAIYNITVDPCDNKKFFGGDDVGIIDIAFGAIIGRWFGVIEEIVGVKLFEAHEFPHLCAWLSNFEEEPAIKQNLPDRDALLTFFKRLRENLEGKI